VAAASPTEPGHRDSRGLLDRLSLGDVEIVDPALAVTEIAAALARKFGDPHLARSIALAFGGAPHVTLVSVDAALARQAADVAAQHRPRAADAIYVAVALRFRAALVTLDEEQRHRAAPLVPTLTPAEALARLR
jgi:predicted nucleic acid-binding protein